MDLQIWGFGEPLSKEKLTLLCLLGEASLPLAAFLTQIAHSGLSLQNNCLKIGWEGRTPFIRLSLGEPSQKGLLQGQSCTKIAPNLSEPSFYCRCPSVFTCLITVCFLDRSRWHHSETCRSCSFSRAICPTEIPHLQSSAPCIRLYSYGEAQGQGQTPRCPAQSHLPQKAPGYVPPTSETCGEEMDALGTTTASRGTPCPKNHKPSLFPSRSSRDGAERDTKLLHGPRNPAQMGTGLKYSPGGHGGGGGPR